MRRFVGFSVSVFAVLSTATTAFAGFDQWTSEVEEDPFSKGVNVTVSNMSSMRSGAIILCDTAEKKIVVRNIPGFAYDSVLDGLEPEFAIAIDGEVLISGSGRTGAVGDNIASSEIELVGDEADKFITAFMEAKRQIAFKDGISQNPAIFRARGSTTSGKNLARCLNK